VENNSGEYSFRDEDGRPTGTERFLLTKTRSGHVTLQCATDLPQERFSRYITYSGGPTHALQCASVFLQPADGSPSFAHFSLCGETLEGVLGSEGMPTTTQQLALSGCAPLFGTHALINDGWFAGLHDPGGAAEQTHRCAVSSVSEHGTSGLAAEIITLHTACTSWSSDVTTPAGTFDVRTVLLAFGSLPPLELTVRREDLLLVRLRWAHTRTHVELTHIDSRRTA
jgi:hypothetical protein